jgi:hypothetical protein
VGISGCEGVQKRYYYTMYKEWVGKLIHPSLEEEEEEEEEDSIQ